VERTTGFEPATLTLAKAMNVPLESAGTAGVLVGDVRSPVEALEALESAALE
jgi:hypothetical protein